MEISYLAIYVRGDTFMPPIYAAKLDQTWQALRNSRQIRTRKSNEGLDGVCGVGACSANQATCVPMLIVTDQTSDEQINKDWLAETKLGANQTEIQDLKIVSNCWTTQAKVPSTKN